MLSVCIWRLASEFCEEAKISRQQLVQLKDRDVLCNAVKSRYDTV